MERAGHRWLYREKLCFADTVTLIVDVEKFVIMEPISETSPRRMARIAGLLYLLITLAAPFGELYVRGRLVVAGDAAATATNILTNESLYRSGGVADLIAFAADVAIALVFYELLKPAGRRVSLLAAFFRLMHAAVVAVATLAYFTPLLLLERAPNLRGFNVEQLQGLSLVSLRLHGVGYNIGLVFFGIHCVLIGYLVYRSTFLPRVLGPLIGVAGMCYLINSFAALLAPAFKARIYPAILMPAGLAELSLTVWLLVVGVNVQRWKDQAAARRG
jgi:Domain of unknown function (DUF4386)